MAISSATACSGPARVQDSLQKALPVTTAHIERRDLARELTLSGEFNPYLEVDLHAKVAGFLSSITVDVGDRVSTGQLVASLEAPELTEEFKQATATERRSQLEVQRIRSVVAQAEAKASLQELVYRRLSNVASTKPNLVAEQEIDNALAQSNEAKAQLDTARADLAVAEQQVRVSAAARSRIGSLLQYLQISVPFAGVVTRRYADPGAMIQAGTASQTQAKPIVRIAQVSRLRLTLAIPESAVPFVHIGTPVELRVDALKRTFHGRVSRASGQIDDETRTMQTEVDLDNSKDILKPGMFAQAVLRLEAHDDALAIPVQALTGDNTGARFAYVVNRDRRIERRAVQTGLETPNFAEVVHGVSAGEAVVVGSRTGLQPGQLVEPKLVADAQTDEES